MVNTLLGQGKDRLEVGIGTTISVNKDLLDSEVVATGTIGYRYYQRQGGFMFRIGITPFWSSDGMRAWGGISVGYGF